jgi:hypothetical protein
MAASLYGYTVRTLCPCRCEVHPVFRSRCLFFRQKRKKQAFLLSSGEKYPFYFSALNRPKTGTGFAIVGRLYKRAWNEKD